MTKKERQRRQKSARSTHNHVETSNPIAVRLQPVVLASLNEVVQNHKISRNGFINEAVATALTRVGRQGRLDVVSQ